MEAYTQLKGRMKSLFLYFALSFLMTGTILLGFAQTIRGQASPDMGFITAAIKETILGKERQTGLFQEKADTIRNANGKDVIHQKKVRTWIFIEADRIFYEYELVRFDPNVEAPESYWWGGYADLNGKLTATVDSSEWFYSLIPEYYHPEARYIITNASVSEGNKPEHLAILDMDGQVVERIAPPVNPTFSVDRSIIAWVHKGHQETHPSGLNLHYLNLDTRQEWVQGFPGAQPWVALLDPADHGVIYVQQDTVYSVDPNNILKWKSGMASLKNGWLNSGDARHFYHGSKGSYIQVFGRELKNHVSDRYLFSEICPQVLSSKAIEGSPYWYTISYVDTRTHLFRLFGPDLSLLGETMIKDGPTASVVAFFRPQDNIVKVYSDMKLIMEWK